MDDCSLYYRDELVVHPSWVLDSIKAGTLLPVDQYLLYQGRKAAQKVLSFTSKTSSTSTINKPSPGGVPSVSLPPSLQSPWGVPSVDVTSLCSTSRPPSTGEPLTFTMLNTTAQEQSTDSKDSETVNSIAKKDSDTITKEDSLPQNSTAVNEGGDFGVNLDDVAFQLTKNVQQEAGNSSLQRMDVSEIHYVETSKSEQETSVFKKPGTSSLPRAGDANFVSEFYNNSRLHYLSTWGAEFKKYTSDIIKSSAAKGWKSRGTGRLGPHGRVIMHIDMDSFFVSVTLRDQPHLRGKPIAVCHAGKSSSTTEQGAMSYSCY